VVQLFVFIAGLVSEQMLKSVSGSGEMNEILANAAGKIGTLQINSLVALIALGCFLAEGITLAASKISAYGLILLRQEFVAAGSPEASHFQSLGNFLYHSVDRKGYDIYMLFFCVGGILWYYLLFSSRVIPLGLAGWGLGAMILLSVPTLLAPLNQLFLPAMVMALPYAPFEVDLGIWLMVKGFKL
jgi:hypothetical protein